MDGRARQLVQELDEARSELADLVGAVAETLSDAAGTVAETVGAAAGTLGAAAGTVAVRSEAAVDALRGGPVGPPLGVRRWPWAVVAAVAGAAAGAGVAVLLQRVLDRPDAPGAQEPEDLEAVVDRGDEGPER